MLEANTLDPQIKWKALSAIARDSEVGEITAQNSTIVMIGGEKTGSRLSPHARELAVNVQKAGKVR